MCVYDEHPLAGQDIQYRAPDSWSRYTTPFDKIIKYLFNVGPPKEDIFLTTLYGLCNLVSLLC